MTIEKEELQERSTKEEIADDESEENVELEDIQELVQSDDDVDMMDEEEMEGEEEEMENDSEMLQEGEFVDDSVQGFFEHRGESIYCVEAHPTLPLAVTGGGDDRARVWSYENGSELFSLSKHEDSCVAVAFSFDGTLVASGGLDGTVFIHKVEDGSLVQKLLGPEEVNWIQWHPKGLVLLAGSSDGTCWMWKLPSGQCMNVFSGHLAPVTCGRFSHSGKQFISGGEDGNVIIWDPKTAEILYKFSSATDGRFHKEPIQCLDLNKDDVIAMTGSSDGSCKLLHLQSHRILGSLENHTDSVETVGFCNTLPLAASGGLDGRLNIWDVTTMRLRQQVAHDDGIVKLLWHQDTPLISTCSLDATVRIWDARSGEVVRTFRGHQAPVLDVAQSPDGHTHITASDDHVSLVFKW